MSLTTMFLLVAALIGLSAGDQASEVFRDDFALKSGVPQFRDISDFLPITTTPEPPMHVSLQGLPPHQHGFQVISPQYQATLNKQTTPEQKEVVRKHEEFLKSIVETNKARTPLNSGNFRLSQTFSDQESFDSAKFKPSLTNIQNFGSQRIPALQAPTLTKSPTTHQIFDYKNHQIQQNNAKSNPINTFNQQKETNFRVGTVKPLQRNNDFIDFQSGSFNRNVNLDHLFTPTTSDDRSKHRPIPSRTFDQNINGFEQIEILKQKSRESFNHKNNNGVQAARPSNLADGKFTKHQGFTSLPHVSSTAAPSTLDFSDQGNDAELRLINQINQNTASFVSQEGKLPIGLPQQDQLRGGTFERISPPPAVSSATRDSSGRPSQEFGVGSHTSVESKRRKVVGQGLRRPDQNQGVQSLFQDNPLPASQDLSNEHRFLTTQRLKSINQAEDEVDEELEARKQAESAKYAFSSAITDTVNDNSQIRHEVRDGLKLSGFYSYSDGFFKRTVFYEADENGYRIVKEESEPVGDGPQNNPNGEIEVTAKHGGSTLQYKIKGDPVKKVKQPISSGRTTGSRFTGTSDRAESFDDIRKQLLPANVR